LALSGFMSCENKELYRCDDAVGLVNVKVVFHWPEDASVMPPLMRLHLYSPEGGLSFVGDFLSGGGIAQVPAGAAWYPVCFDYRGPQTVDFRGAGYRDTFEAYCYPREASLEGVPSPVVAEPSPDSFYAGYNAGLFAVPEDAIPGDTVILDMYPREALRAFSFLLVGVEDVSGIADIRGFFSGLPGSYFPGTGGVPASPSSLLFTGLAPLKDGMRQPWTQSQKALFSALSSSWDKPGSADAWTGGWITGRVASFPPPPLSSQTFRLALEALGKGGEDIYAIWDDEVTRQMRGALGANGTPEEQEQWRQRNGGYDIVLYNSGRLAIPEGGGGGGAFETGLDDWNNVDIPLGGPVF
jgi:hypothetical protein